MYVNDSMYRQYQQRVLYPNEVVRYDSIVMSAYKREDIQREPFIGLKILLKDNNFFRSRSPEQRLREIDSVAWRILQGSGCILRESNNSVMGDGIWLITFPSPRSLLETQMRLLIRVLQNLEYSLGLVQTNLIETCISVRCPENEVGGLLQRGVHMSPRYMNCIVRPTEQQFMTYTFGNVTPINRDYSLIRIRWMCNENESFRHPETLRDFVDYVTTKISGAFYYS